MSDTSRKRRSARQARTRKRSIYTEVDTEDDFSVSDDEFTGSDRPLKRSRHDRPVRGGRQQPDFVDAGPSNATPPRVQQTRRQKPAHPRRSKRNTTVGEDIINKVAACVGKKRRMRPIGAAKRSVKPATHVVRIASDGVSPPWQNLPYEILLQIFTFAYTADAHSWLLKTARGVCRAFAEPALTAFYQSPRLPTSAHLDHLHALSQYAVGHGWINYAVKVRRLELDIHTFVNRKDDDETFELASLISKLPKLEAVLITSAQDKPPYRRHTLPRWKYPSTLFGALGNTERQLKSWRWNWLFVRQSGVQATPRLYDLMCKHHSSPAFQNVRHLEISDHPEFLTSTEEQAHQEDKIAEAIALLPSLRSLELETCDIVNARFLERLPKSLVALRMANCEALTSEAITTFLSQDGGCQLETLVLDHNVRLDLSFLPLLKTTCSKLKHLSMDLHYYSQHHTVNDAEARYKQLLADDQIPTWPTTMESIELVHLQKWDAKGAHNFFGSLIDSAQDLPHLRSIVLHAHISIEWRHRASFREEWQEKLANVFLRRCKDPEATLASLKSFRMAKDIERRQSVVNTAAVAGGRTVEGFVVPRHSLSADEVSGHESTQENTQESEGTPANARRSKRIADVETQRAVIAQPTRVSFSAEATSDDDSAGSVTGQVEFFRQGLCNTVDIKIDNQRPREEQFNESHFLDSEESGDDDWQAEGDELLEEMDEGYAW